jgi:hypothetical protein
LRGKDVSWLLDQKELPTKTYPWSSVPTKTRPSFGPLPINSYNTWAIIFFSMRDLNVGEREGGRECDAASRNTYIYVDIQYQY